MLKKTLARCAVLSLITAIAWAAKPPNGTYNTFDQNGTNIGWTGVSNHRNDIGYIDNPNTSHPPDTNAVYNYNPNTGRYEDGNGYDVEFIALEAGGYAWLKRDSGGNVVDSGTIQQPSPIGPPGS